MQRGLNPTSQSMAPGSKVGNNVQSRTANDAVSTGPCLAQDLREREFPILSSRNGYHYQEECKSKVRDFYLTMRQYKKHSKFASPFKLN